MHRLEIMRRMIESIKKKNNEVIVDCRLFVFDM